MRQVFYLSGPLDSDSNPTVALNPKGTNKDKMRNIHNWELGLLNLFVQIISPNNLQVEHISPESPKMKKKYLEQ